MSTPEATPNPEAATFTNPLEAAPPQTLDEIRAERAKSFEQRTAESQARLLNQLPPERRQEVMEQQRQREEREAA